MDSLEYTGPTSTVRPLPGRVLLEIEPPLATYHSIIIPETSRLHRAPDSITLTARVLAIGYGGFYENISPRKWKHRPGVFPSDVLLGNRVVFKALLSDLDCKVILTSVTRIEAVIEEE
jgi:hypothetical protein